jgi:U3 small nucleolar RNA-associated protein 15
VRLLKEKDVRPTVTFALIQELVQRDALRIALSGRDDVTLEPILSFLARHVIDPRFGETASEVAGVLIGESRRCFSRRI